ncbi:MAG TPA: hypothetical protein VJ483_05725 [Holophagaceae bacterium]|nr:hypothetical protein [Holophagaceae bacterium]
MGCGLLLLVLLVLAALMVAFLARALRRPGDPTGMELFNAAMHGGLLAGVLWTAGVVLLQLITRAGSAGFWFLFAPLAGFLGAIIGVGVRMRRPRT